MPKHKLPDLVEIEDVEEDEEETIDLVEDTTSESISLQVEEDVEGPPLPEEVPVATTSEAVVDRVVKDFGLDDSEEVDEVAKAAAGKDLDYYKELTSITDREILFRIREDFAKDCQDFGDTDNIYMAWDNFWHYKKDNYPIVTRPIVEAPVEQPAATTKKGRGRPKGSGKKTQVPELIAALEEAEQQEVVVVEPVVDGSNAWPLNEEPVVVENMGPTAAQEILNAAPVEVLSDNQSRAIGNKIQLEDVSLVQVTVKGLGFLFGSEKADLDSGMDEELFRLTFSRIPKEALEDVRSARADLMKIPKKYAIPFDISVLVIPNAKAIAFAEEMEVAEEHLRSVYMDFLNNHYDAEVVKAQARIRASGREPGQYPNKDTLWNRLEINWPVIPIVPPGGEMGDRLKKQFEGRMRTFQEKAIQGLEEQLLKAADVLSSCLTKKVSGKYPALKDASLENLKRTVEMIRDMQTTLGDNGLVELAARFEDILSGKTGEDLRGDKDLRQAMADRFTGALNDLENSVEYRETVRRIRVRKQKDNDELQNTNSDEHGTVPGPEADPEGDATDGEEGGDT